jgi:hypothetical protein
MPRAIPQALLAATLAAGTGGCAPPEEGCGLESTVGWYAPSCAAVLVRYPEETRLFVDDLLVGYLPAEVAPETVYGGTSGNPLTLLLGESLATARLSTVTFGASLTEVRIEADFSEGEVWGIVEAELRQGDR